MCWRRSRGNSDVEDNINNLQGSYGVYLACSASNPLETIQRLVKAGHSVNASFEGKSPLFVAPPQVVGLLLEHGADKEAKDQSGHTPLTFSCAKGNKDVAVALMKGGVDVNATTNIGETSLHIASSFEDVELVKSLLDFGANLESRDTDGFTPLHSAARNDRTGMCELLLERGACANAVDARGRTALFHASRHGRHDAVRVLLASGCDVQAADCEGDTALHVAIQYSRSCDSILQILQAGGCPDVKNMAGISPRFLLKESKFSDQEKDKMEAAMNEVERSSMVFVLK